MGAESPRLSRNDVAVVTDNARGGKVANMYIAQDEWPAMRHVTRLVVSKPPSEAYATNFTLEAS